MLKNRTTTEVFPVLSTTFFGCGQNDQMCGEFYKSEAYSIWY